MATFDLAIMGGTIIDGLRTPRYRSDIGVKDGKIARIGRIDPADADRVIDATGQIVAPGAVDLHTHYDGQLFWDPWCTISGWHGVTSLVIGNCGFGFAPCHSKDRDRAMLSLSRNEAVPLKTMQLGLPWDWESFGEFLDSVDRTPKGVNIMSFVPLAPIYGYVIGLDEAKSRPSTDEELDEMCRILEDAMVSGGCGFSAQIVGAEGNNQLDYDGTPMVTDTMSDRDLRAFSRVLRKLGRGVVQVTTRNIDRAAMIAEESGQPVIWNVLVADGHTNQHGDQHIEGGHRESLRRLKELNEERGLRVYGQAITTNFASEFTFEDYNLQDNYPVWREATLGTVEEKLAKLADPVRRVALKELNDERGGLFGPGYPLVDIKVHWISSDVPNATQLKDEYEGYTVGEIAAREGKHLLDAMLDLAVAGQLKVGFATPLLEIPTDALAEVANGPVSIPGISDGGAHTKFITTGRYATEMLSHWVRDKGVMSLEDAHWRLSTLPATAAGLKGRGWLAVGQAADILVYDLDELGCEPPERVADYPGGEWRLITRPKGYSRIIVNGEPTFENGKCTQATPGRLLRHGAA